MQKILNKILAILIILFILSFTIIPVVKAATNKTVVIVLDPGHGGKMTGAVNNQKGLIERDLTLKIARYVRDYLNEYENIKVIMTHDGLPSDVEMELPARGMVARNNNADMLISFHLNDSTDRSAHGAEVYVTANTSLPKYHEESAKFGNMVLKNISALGIRNNGVKTRLCQDEGPKWEYSDGTKADYYAVIRYPMKGDGEDRGADLAKGEGIPGILIEHCYMYADSQYLDSDADLQKLARADANAIIQYYGLEKKDPSRVSGITLNSSSATILNGEKTKLTATVTPSTAKNKNVKWTSSNTNVLAVSSSGEVTAVGVGTATITATTEDRGKTASATITVKDVTITLDKKETHVIVGNKLSVGYTISPDIVKNKEVTWKSSDTTLATVDSKGVITAIKEGTVTITATTKTGSKTASIKVNIRKLSGNQKLKVNNLKQENAYLSKIGEKVTVTNLKKNFEISQDLEVIVKNAKNEELKDTDIVTTDTLVAVREKESKTVLQEYDCIIYGDVNGDGKISALDYAYIKNDIMDVEKIAKTNKKLVADVNGDGKISALDYAYIKNHIMDIQKIELR